MSKLLRATGYMILFSALLVFSGCSHDTFDSTASSTGSASGSSK